MLTGEANHSTSTGAAGLSRLLPVCASSKACRPRMAVHNATSAYCEPTVARSRNQNWLAVHCHDVETTHGRTRLFCGSLRKAHLVEWAGHHRAGVRANRCLGWLRVHRTQVRLHDLSRDRASQNVACLLVVAPMDPAVDACVIDIVGDLVELRVVLSDDRGRQGTKSGNVVGDGDVVARGAEKTSHHLKTAVGAACVVRWIAREARGRDERREAGVAFGLIIAVCCAVADPGFGTPAIVVILVHERGN